MQNSSLFNGIFITCTPSGSWFTAIRSLFLRIAREEPVDTNITKSVAKQSEKWTKIRRNRTVDRAYITADQQRALHHGPEREVSPLLRDRQAFVTDLEHVSVIPCADASDGCPCIADPSIVHKRSHRISRKGYIWNSTHGHVALAGCLCTYRSLNIEANLLPISSPVRHEFPTY